MSKQYLDQDRDLLRLQMKTISSTFLNDVQIDEDYAKNAEAAAKSVTQLYDRLHPSGNNALLFAGALFFATCLNAITCITVLIKELFRS